MDRRKAQTSKFERKRQGNWRNSFSSLQELMCKEFQKCPSGWFSESTVDNVKTVSFPGWKWWMLMKGKSTRSFNHVSHNHNHNMIEVYKKTFSQFCCAEKLSSFNLFSQSRETDRQCVLISIIPRKKEYGSPPQGSTFAAVLTENFPSPTQQTQITSSSSFVSFFWKIDNVRVSIQNRSRLAESSRRSFLDQSPIPTHHFSKQSTCSPMPWRHGCLLCDEGIFCERDEYYLPLIV